MAQALGTPTGRLALDLGRLALGRLASRLAQPSGSPIGRHALVVNARGQAEILTTGPHFGELPARGQLEIVCIGPVFQGLSPAFQSFPGRALTFDYRGRSILIHNTLDRGVAFFLVFMKTRTLEDFALLIHASRPPKGPPP